MRRKTQRLAPRKLRVKANGRYPNGTAVADVAVYQNDGTKQNDGTERIAPSHFVERAAAAAHNWSAEVDRMLFAYLFLDVPLVPPLQIEKDISDTCDRVKTRRLKTSFESEIV